VVKTRVWVVDRSIFVEMDAEVMVEESMIGSDEDVGNEAGADT
jgi:hypothetical protein